MSAYDLRPCPQLFPYAQGEPKVSSSSPFRKTLSRALLTPPRGQFNGPLHRYLFPRQHSSPTPPPPPPASRQSKPQQPLTQPTEPKPRTSMNSKSAGYA